MLRRLDAHEYNTDTEKLECLVARIAYLSSDVVISVQPAQAIDSEFSKTLHSLAALRIPGVIACAEGSIPEVSPPHQLKLIPTAPRIVNHLY
jgi:hypothetical protein